TVGPNATVSFSYLGFNDRRNHVGQEAINIKQLSVDETSVHEVAVTRYVTTTKLRQPGLTAVVQATDVEPNLIPSIDRALQGKDTGLQSTGGSGQPGSMQQVRIRGVGSISGSSAPLYVIDGIQVNSGDLSRATPTANVLAGIN